MMRSIMKAGVLITIASGILVGGTGCVIAQIPPECISSPKVGSAYYCPQYYDRYLVYYDDDGDPFYYESGSISYVPRSSRNYGSLRRHYHTHTSDYRRWYEERGEQYRHRPPRDRRYAPEDRGPDPSPGRRYVGGGPSRADRHPPPPDQPRSRPPPPRDSGPVAAPPDPRPSSPPAPGGDRRRDESRDTRPTPPPRQEPTGIGHGSSPRYRDGR
jgi:hypothetical protein